MKEPSEEQFETYRRVREHLKDAKVRQLAGHLKPEDSLLAPGSSTVEIGAATAFDGQWDRYMEGYYDAADTLVDEYASKLEASWIVYPILFMYRHSLELLIKSLIMEAVASFRDLPRDISPWDFEFDSEGNPILLVSSDDPHSKREEPKNPDITNQHNLLKLWAVLEQIVAENRRRPMLADTGTIKRILEEFTRLDDRSLNTRYGLQRDMQTPSIAPSRISLRNVQLVMGRMYNGLHDLLVRFRYVAEPWWDEDLRNKPPDEVS
ncbi:MAG: hypothetical protein WD696_22360 [Bryobacteraceae bacterium]